MRLLLTVKWLKIARIGRKEIVKITYSNLSTDITIFRHLYHVLVRTNPISVFPTIKSLFTKTVNRISSFFINQGCFTFSMVEM